jgi:hypothetical protein
MRYGVSTRTAALLVALAAIVGSACLAVPSDSQNSPEETVVRTTYAKLSYADEIHIMMMMLRPTPDADPWKADPLAADKALKERLSFQLSDFKTGNVADIAQQTFSDLVTTWDKGSDTLRANPSVWNYAYTEGDTKITASVPYGTFFWEKSPYPKTPVVDWPLSEVLAKGPEFHGPYSRYATYTVTATFQRHSRTYKAMALFRENSEVYFIDNVTSATMLVLLSKTPIYPAPLAETHLRNVPFVRKWLFDHQQVCGPGHQQKSDACCEVTTGICGIGAEDLRSPSISVPKQGKQGPGSRRQQTNEPHLVLAGFHPRQPTILAQASSGVASCESSNQSTNFPHVQINKKDHGTGQHGFGSAIPAQCSYTAGPVGQQNCNAQCTSGSAGAGNESGFTLAFLFHPNNTSDFTGQAFSVNGSAQCQGTSAISFMGCETPGCAIGLSITASGNGVGATINFPPGALWNDQNAGLITCNAIPQPTPTPTPTPTPPPPPPVGGGGGGDPCLGSGGDGTPDTGNNGPDCSPIILDIAGEGFHLTSAQTGVMFDISGTGKSIQIAWTDPHFQNAFLALPGPDGLVHNGKELFGNFTPQPTSPSPNGFLALAVYDQPQNGGNGDGIIDARDGIFSSLRLWIDKNHDGICQAEELYTLPELGIFSLSLDYSLSRREDDYGNVFRYKAKVNPLTRDDTSRAGPWAYDVFLVTR